MYSEQTENPKKLRVLFFVQFAGNLRDCKSYVRISLELFAWMENLKKNNILRVFFFFLCKSKQNKNISCQRLMSVTRSKESRNLCAAIYTRGGTSNERFSNFRQK